MSIWMSHSGDLVVPDRDQYTGEPTGDPVALAFDVASSWTDIFRFAVYSVEPHSDGWQGAVGDNVTSYLTADEGRQLIALIQSGIDAVEADATAANAESATLSEVEDGNATICDDELLL